MKTPLEESIEHWQRLAFGNRLAREDYSSHSCALCKAYFKDPVDVCNKCPVKLKTGKAYCEGSPYDSVRELEDKWDEEGHHEDENIMDSEDFKKVAQKELEFLQSLLPNKTI